MSYPRRTSVTVTCDGSGAATVNTPLQGYLQQISYVKPASGGLANATIAITNAATGETIWSQSTVNASVVLAPRQPTHTTAGVASLYAAAGTPVNDRIAIAAGDALQIAISSAGAGNAGTFHFITE